MTKKDTLKNPETSGDETKMTNAKRKITFWEDGKGWKENPSLEKKILSATEFYEDKNSNGHYCAIVGKIFPAVYSVYTNADGTVQAAYEPNLPKDYVEHTMPKCENPVPKLVGA
jgi:hypothetical protein